MINRHLLGSAFTAALVSVAPAALGQLAWDEVGQGDFSNSGLSPTGVSVGLGDNFVYGNLGPLVNGGIDRDYFSVTVPAGLVLSRIVLDLYDGEDPIAFLGLVIGATISVDPEEATTDDVDGFVLFGTAGPTPFGEDMLDNMALAHEPPRLTSPLPAGTYTLWVQQLDGNVDYGFNFVLEVPSPGGWMGAAVLAVGLGRRRRDRVVSQTGRR